MPSDAITPAAKRGAVPHWLKWLLLPLAAAAIILAMSWWQQGRPDRQNSPAPLLAPRVTPIPWAQALADTDDNIAALKARIDSPAGDMIDHEQLSVAYVGRSKLSSDFTDLVRARKAADAGIAASPPGTGPWLAKAAAEYSAHRITDAERALDVVDKFVVPDAETRAEATAIRADIAFARGNYELARRWLAAAEAIDQWPGLFFRQAVLARFTGDPDRARALFARAEQVERNPSPLFRAMLLLRQGEIDYAQGRFDDARARYEAAQRIVPGHWQIDMRVAQMQAIAGNTREALSVFEGIANRLNHPDAMYVAAGLNRDLGDNARADAWIVRAGKVWQERLAMLPEAAWGHAIEHELAFGQPARALKLAARDVRNRPFAPSLLLLAEAWAAMGRPDYAVALCQKVEASGWVSADQWKIRAAALTKLGRTSEAATARARALELNPRKFDANPALAWFHD